MKNKYKLIITCSGFGTEEEVKKQYSKEGVVRIFDFDTSEFMETEDEHHSGTFIEILEIEPTDLKFFMKKYLSENDMEQECFGIYNFDDNKYVEEVLTEDNL